MRALAILAAMVLPSTVFAQQSLFNVPATQGTVPGHLFGQVQVGAGAEGGDVSTTLELGVFEWLEVGVNVLRLPLYQVGDLQPGSPASSTTLLNANVIFEPLPWFAVQFGGQVGAGFAPPPGNSEVSNAVAAAQTSTAAPAPPFAKALEPVAHGWATVRFEAPGRFGSWILGAYTGSRGALGKGPPVGAMLGFEIPLWEHVLHAQGDWLIGMNDISVAAVGLVVFLGKYLQLSVGAQLPSPGSGNTYGGILALTFVPLRPDDEKHPSHD